jgi:hypothetical protein
VAIILDGNYPNLKEREIAAIKVIKLCLNGQTGIGQWIIKQDGNKTASYLIKLIPDVRGNTHFAVEQDRESVSDETSGPRMLKERCLDKI